MNTNDCQLMELIKQGEGLSLEFKECRNHFNRDIFHTVCSFLNRHGGTLLLGVQDNGEVSGINPEAVNQLKKNFVTAINNPQKINPACYLSITESSNRPHGFGMLDPSTFTPFPKNPVIGRFFRQIGRADEPGSGMRKMMKYGKPFGGADPELVEGDVFRIIINCHDFNRPSVKQKTLRPETEGQVTEQVLRLLSVLKSDMSR